MNDAKSSPADTWSQSALTVRVPRSPMSPCLEDRAIMQEALAPFSSEDYASPVIVLGVTPAIIQLPWPGNATILAVDGSPAIIRGQWRPNPSAAAFVAQGFWQDLPVADHAALAVVGDCSLNALPDCAIYPEVLREVARTLRRDGILVLRCFIKPDEDDSVEAIAEAAANKAFANGATFRLRLYMTLAKDDGGVVLGEILEQFDKDFPDRRKFAEAAGWPMEEFDLFEMDRGSTVRLTFPTLSALLALAEPFFEVRSIRRGSYPMADCCPTIVFTPR